MAEPTARQVVTHTTAWDETWSAIAETMSRRSRCSLTQVGAVITDVSNRVVATGYNGPPAGTFNVGLCSDWCPRGRSTELARTFGYANCVSIHAEANALLFCDRAARTDGTMYVTTVPCFDCAKLIANSGLVRVVCPEPTEADAHRKPQLAIDFMEAARIVVDHLE